VISWGSDDERLLTVREVADELRLTQQTVRQWIRDAKLPAIRAGQRKYLVRSSDLRRVIVFANGTTYPANEADSPFDAPTTGEHELWDLASHARPPR
jgi:excisionase family DNA binding protein